MTTTLNKHNNEALISVDNAQKHDTRQTGFSLDQSKLTKNLIKDAIINDYKKIVNNYEENVNIKCKWFLFRSCEPSIALLSQTNVMIPLSWSSMKLQFLFS